MFGIKDKNSKLVLIRSDDENPPYTILPDYRTYAVKSRKIAEKEAKRINDYYDSHNYIASPQVVVFELTEDQILENLVWGLKVKRS